MSRLQSTFATCVYCGHFRVLYNERKGLCTKCYLNTRIRKEMRARNKSIDKVKEINALNEWIKGVNDLKNDVMEDEEDEEIVEVIDKIDLSQFHPTEALPGTLAKLKVLRERADKRFPLFHKNDRLSYDDEGNGELIIPPS